MADEFSFIANVNSVAGKLGIIESANDIFDEGVIPVLEEIAALELEDAIEDLKKGNYLGNRKVDINLALNMVGITQDLIDTDPDAAELIWTDPAKTVLYDSADITFTDGTVMNMPFLFDGSPTTISTHGDLLIQLNRYDNVDAVAQVDTVNTFVAVNATIYTITINGIDFSYTSDADATIAEIVAGLVLEINVTETNGTVPVTAVNVANTSITLTADVAGTAFIASINGNMAIDTTVANVPVGTVAETPFLAKLEDTIISGFATDVVGELVRFYDIIGVSSNIERIALNASSGPYIEARPIYYWAKTTSAFQTLSMRAGDIIKLGNEIDNIILLADSISQVLELQSRIPELVDTYVNDVAQGDETIYNRLAELVAIYGALTEIVAVHGSLANINTTGTNIASVNSVAVDLTGANTIGAVGSNIASVVTTAGSIANVNTVATDITNVNSVATTVVPNIAEILLADDNAATATTKAGEASASAIAAAASLAEIESITVGSTTTGAAGTLALVTYNSGTNQFAFVVPQGIKGDQGDAFEVNAVGLIADRSLYDNQQTGFSFLALDESLIYFKLSATTADWSAGAPFGKGDTGDTGATGNGILSIVFTSTTHVSTLAGQSGGLDTYTITYTDTTTDSFVVYNGLDAGDASTIVFTPNGDIVATDVQAAIVEVRNDTDTKLSGKEPADATILKDADIGVNVQAYDATILVDADIGVNIASQVDVDSKAAAYNYVTKSDTYTAVANDFIYADTSVKVAQIDTIDTFTAIDSTLYTITIDGIAFDYTSGVGATIAQIIDGLVLEINVTQTNGIVPVTALNVANTSLTLTADVAGVAFTASINANMAVTTTIANKPGEFTITLPATPTADDKVSFLDVVGNFSVDNLTVARNGETIMGLAEDMVVSTNNISFELIYTNSDWRLV